MYVLHIYIKASVLFVPPCSADYQNLHLEAIILIFWFLFSLLSKLTTIDATNSLFVDIYMP